MMNHLSDYQYMLNNYFRVTPEDTLCGGGKVSRKSLKQFIEKILYKQNSGKADPFIHSFIHSFHFIHIHNVEICLRSHKQQQKQQEQQH